MRRIHHLCASLPTAGIVLALSLAAAGPAVVSLPDRPDAAAAARGRLTYQRYCTSCHGLAARGNGPAAMDLRTRVPDLTTIAARHHGIYPFQRVVRVIDGGEAGPDATRDMPAWNEVFKRTRGTDAASPGVAINNLAHYLWSLQSVTGDNYAIETAAAP